MLMESLEIAGNKLYNPNQVLMDKKLDLDCYVDGKSKKALLSRSLTKNLNNKLYNPNQVLMDKKLDLDCYVNGKSGNYWKQTI